MKNQATILGCIALFIWSFSATLFSSLSDLPRFEITFFVFLASFVLSCVWITTTNKWRRLSLPPTPQFLIGVGGIYLANLCFVFALKFAPPEIVEILSYLWQIFTFMVMQISLRRFQWHQLCGSALSFIGIVLLIKSKPLSHVGLWMSYWKGYLFVLGYVCLWSLYILQCKRNKQIPTEIIGIYCGVGALASLIFHLKNETFVMPTFTQSATMLGLGISCQGAAYLFWDHAIKHGNAQLLLMLSYFTPLLSVAALVAFGYCPPHPYLGFATILVCAGSLIGLGRSERQLR